MLLLVGEEDEGAVEDAGQSCGRGHETPERDWVMIRILVT